MITEIESENLANSNCAKGSSDFITIEMGAEEIEVDKQGSTRVRSNVVVPVFTPVLRLSVMEAVTTT